MWIYQTKQFITDLQRYHAAEFLEGRNTRISHATTRAQASRIAKPYAGFLVTRHQNLRLIGNVEVRGGHETFVWYTILKRGDSEYKAFNQYSQRIRNDFFDSRHYEEWLADMERSAEEAARPVPLPDDLLPWLTPMAEIFATGDANDVHLYETERWVNDIASVPTTMWSRVLELATHAVQRLETDEHHPLQEVLTVTIGDYSLSAQKTEDRAIFLLGVSHQDQQVSTPPPLPVGSQAVPLARRTYPTWLLADPVTWFDIQDGKSYNLALSPEEQQLLRRAAGGTAEGSELPMFINGQAGSGKSTMLAYIFAGMCKMQTTRQTGGRPLFLTYNTQLLEKARQTTRRILHADLEMTRRFTDTDLDSLFCGWHDYLVSLLPEDAKTRFERNKRVDYNDFALAWSGRASKLPVLQARRDHSPEMVWYVIRSLIKGADASGDLLPEDYAIELTRDERTIDEGTYTHIYKEYYRGWYEPALQQRGLWDDQDLTQEALEAVDDSEDVRNVAALVIDEVQDFTRRELRLLTRTTAYSDYAIPTQGLGIRPPIILAGDPLQTLSPTGFRWSAVKAGVYEELVGLFGPDNANPPVLTELLKNYRSDRKIVSLANAIQLWRTLLFRLPDVRPQEPWRPEIDVNAPGRFTLDQVDEADFIRFAADTVLIVPCEEGGELDFVKRDEILSKMFPDASDLNPPATVFSAASIKGLEYEKVLLYKFGESAEGISWEPARADTERNLQAEYFFNKLYVAATRATHHLFVVDTQAGDAALWEHLDGEAVEKLLAAATKAGIPHFAAHDLAGIEYGPPDLEGVQEKNPRENALKTKRYAAETRSSRKMRQAASYFRRAGERREADECEAWALQYEESTLAAGRKFMEASCPADAWRCLWDEGAWPELGTLAARKPEVSAAEFAAVTYMVTESRGLRDLERLSKVIQLSGSSQRFRGRAWVGVVESMTREVGAITGATEDVDLQLIAESLETLFDSGHEGAGLSAAKLYSIAGNRRQAQVILERLPNTSADAAQLLCEITGLPTGLRYLAEAGLQGQIRDAWTAAGRPYDDQWLTFVLPTLDDRRFIEDLLTVLLERGRVDEASERFLAAGDWRGNTADFARRITETFGSQGLATEGVGFIASASALRFEGATKSKLQQVLVLALASRLERNEWRPPMQHDLEGLRSAVRDIYEALRDRNKQFDKLNHANVPALGALCEMSGYSRWSRALYLRFSNVNDIPLRDYCRRRYLFMTTQVLKDSDVKSSERPLIQAEQHANAKTWGLDIDQRSHQRSSYLRAPLADTPEVPQSTGTIGPVTWSQPDQTRLNLEFDNGSDLLGSARLSLDGGQHRQLGVEITTTDDGEIVTSAGTFSASVTINSELRISVSNGDSQLGHALIARRSGPTPDRPAPTKRTRGGVRAQPKASPTPTRPAGIESAAGTGQLVSHKLAKELGLRNKELMDLADSLGISRRSGTDRFTSDEVARIRQASAKRSSLGSISAEDLAKELGITSSDVRVIAAAAGVELSPGTLRFTFDEALRIREVLRTWKKPGDS